MTLVYRIANNAILPHTDAPRESTGGSGKLLTVLKSSSSHRRFRLVVVDGPRYS